MQQYEVRLIYIILFLTLIHVPVNFSKVYKLKTIVNANNR